MTPEFDALPLVAILRGVRPEEAPAIAAALHDASFRVIEVPLNSPRPLETIALLARERDDCLVGAGTVLAPEQVDAVHRAGGRVVIAPNFDPAVVAAARARGMLAVPGVATPTEAFAALAAGAAALKLFPAEGLPPAVLRAWRAVLPPEALLLPVGGITPDTMAGYLEAGASGFGLGSALFRPGDTAQRVGAAARTFAQRWRALHGQLRA